MLFSLKPHPANPPRKVFSVSVAVTPLPDRRLGLRYRVSGSGSIVVSTAAPKVRTDGLWRQTCFELFVKPDDRDGYYEWNFAPSGAWAAYRFDSYRGGMRALPFAVPDIVRHDDGIDVEIDGSVFTGSRFAAGLCAVIEEAGGALSYWALDHASEKPDFHHPACFMADLSALR